MKKDNKRKIIITIAIFALLILTFGGSLALWTYFKIGGNQVLIAGDIYMKYTGVNNLSVTNAVPSDTYNKNDYFEFTVEGNNTYANDIIYDIVLHHGDKPEDENRTERIRDDLLNFRLVKVNNGETEEELIQEGNYESIEENRIWVDTIAGKTKEKVSVKYRLYVWVSNKIKIGLGDNIDYDTDTWNSKVYASIKVSVTGDFKDKSLDDSTAGGDANLVDIKYTSSDNVTITNENKIDISSYYKTVVNPNMTSEQLSDCTRIFNKLNEDNGNKWFISSEDAESFCEGTGTSNGKNLQYYVNYNYFKKSGIVNTLKVKKIIIDKFDSIDRSIYTYSLKINTSSSSSVLNLCTSYLSTEEFDGWFASSESASAYCEGTGTSNGSLFQKDLDNRAFTETQLLYLKNNNIIIENDSQSELSSVPYFEFTVEKKEENFDKDIWYEIILKRDDSSKIDDSLLNFNLVKVEGSKEIELVTNYSSNDLSNAKIYVDKANKETNKITYRLYSWIFLDESSVDSFEAKVNVNVISQMQNIPFEESILTKGNAVEVIKSTVDIAGGVIGVTNNNEKVNSISDDVREYRYSGSYVNNYIKFNNELWRIVGVFKDETGKEFLKIVRNEVINGDNIPETYQVGEDTYDMRFQTENELYKNFAYYNANRKFSGDPNTDWTTSGIQYWLNSKGTGDNGYLNTILENYKNMIASTKYYLGNITDSFDNGIEDTPITAYEHERKSEKCTSYGSTDKQSPPCYIWPNSQANWTGKIGLIYPSDFGFSADSRYWNTQLNVRAFQLAARSSWLKNLNGSYREVLISPTSYGQSYQSQLDHKGIVFTGTNSKSVPSNIRPSLYLKNDVQIVSGDGTKEKPYEIKCTSCTSS